MKARQECPGYKDYFEVMWKDQNELVPQKAKRQRVARAKKKASEVATASRSVSPQILPNTETECLSFFFTNYVDVTADPEAQIGYLELLLPLHGKVASDSPLSLATSALAANITFASFGRSLDSELPCMLFNKALALTQNAINDPMQSATDETLVTVLMLGACDILSRTARSQRPSGIHKNGALALVKHRGPLNFKSELSRRLLIAVRHHTIRMALWTGEQIPADPTVWANVGTMPESSATILDTYAADLANLNVRMEALSTATSSPAPSKRHSTESQSTPPNTASDDKVDSYQSILPAATQLEARLAKWPNSVPPSWLPITVSSPFCIDPSITTAGIYGASCDIYPSINIAGLWNWYRTLRIATIKMIMVCQESLLTREDLLKTTAHLVKTVQLLIDEFCSSIPFHLGNRNGPMLSHELEKVIYPCLPLPVNNAVDGPRCATATSTAEHKRAAICSGAWFILDPLREMMKATAVATPFAPIFAEGSQSERKALLPLREGQREWLLGQMMRVMNMNLYGRAQSASTVSSKTPSISLSTSSLSTPSASPSNTSVVPKTQKPHVVSQSHAVRGHRPAPYPRPSNR